MTPTHLNKGSYYKPSKKEGLDHLNNYIKMICQCLAVQMDFSQTTFKDHLRVHCKPAYQRQNKDHYKDKFTYIYAGV